MHAISSSTIAIWFGAAITCVGAAISRSQLNVLLRLFAELEPELWREAGEPSGLFSEPRGSFFTGFLTQDPSIGWLTATPTWIASRPAALQVLARARVGTVILVLGVVCLVGVIAWNS